jgi:hypothetical protein
MVGNSTRQGDSRTEALVVAEQTYGDHSAFEYLSWASKFLADALTAEMDQAVELVADEPATSNSASSTSVFVG